MVYENHEFCDFDKFSMWKQKIENKISSLFIKRDDSYKEKNIEK